MIVRTILFKTWQPPNVPGRLVLNDDGVMFERPSNAMRVPKERMANNRKNFGERVKAYQAAKLAATRLRITEFIMRNPRCTLDDILLGVSMGRSAVQSHLRNLRSDGRLNVEQRRIGQANVRYYKWQERL